MKMPEQCCVVLTWKQKSVKRKVKLSAAKTRDFCSDLCRLTLMCLHVFHKCEICSNTYHNFRSFLFFSLAASSLPPCHSVRPSIYSWSHHSKERELRIDPRGQIITCSPRWPALTCAQFSLRLCLAPASETSSYNSGMRCSCRADNWSLSISATPQNTQVKEQIWRCSKAETVSFFILSPRVLLKPDTCSGDLTKLPCSVRFLSSIRNKWIKCKRRFWSSTIIVGKNSVRRKM